MKTILLFHFLYFIVHFGNAQNFTTVSGKTLTNENYVIRTETKQYKLESNDDGYFETEIEVNTFPFFYLIFKMSNKGKYHKVSSLIWNTKDSNNPNLTITEDHVELSHKSEMQLLSESIENKKGKERIENIVNNLNQIPSLYFLNEEKENISLARLKTTIQQIPAKYQKNSFVERVKSFHSANIRSKIKKGHPLESFFLEDNSGKKQDVLRENGKTKIIAVLSSSCGYSLASLSLLEQINNHDTEKIEIITIWEDQTSAVWEIDERKQKEKIKWTNLWDKYEFANQYLKVKAVPTFYVVTANGILADRFGGYSKRTAKKFGKLLKEQ